jgi:hypothetical protein
MALPMNTMPTFNMKVPSTGKIVKYRPFVVKEEKALLIAQQSEDIKVMVDTLKNVIASCLTEKLDMSSLAIFDLEYMFTQIRGKSVGETIELLFPCDTDHGEDMNKKAISKVKINVSDINVVIPEGHTNRIELFDDVGMVMKYPSVDITKDLEDLDGGTNVDNIFEVILQCVDFVYQGNDVYYAKDQTREELLTFLNNLTSEQFGKVQRYFETMPKMSSKIEYECPVCGRKHEKLLEGLQSFFS